MLCPSLPQIALDEAKWQWPGRSIGVLVSLGCGLESLAANKCPAASKPTSLWTRFRQVTSAAALAVMPPILAAPVVVLAGGPPSAVQPPYERMEVQNGF